MSSLAATNSSATQEQAQGKARVIQPAWVRAMHWTNAFAMILMIMSGWQIYNASPLFPFRFAGTSRWAAGLAVRCCGTSPRCGC